MISARHRLVWVSVLLAYSAIAQCAEEEFAKWAKAHAVPIKTIDLRADDSDLLPLESAIGNAHIVAFGEPAHGVHEPLAFRNRLFRFLVERMGFTAIALESGFTESVNARSFIEGGVGDADTAARTGLTSGIDRYLESRELIQWMREYNAAGHHRVRLYGIDLPSGARVGGARRAINSALAFLSRADPTAAPRISLSNNLPQTDAGGRGSRHILRHRRVPTLERHYPGINCIPIQHSRRRRQWQALRKLSRRFQIALRRAKFFGRAMCNEPPTGSFALLAKWLRCCFRTPTSGGLPSKPMEYDSIDRALSDLGLPSMFLDIRQARQSKEALAWLSTPRGAFANISAQSLLTPATALDAFFFLDNLTPAITSP